MLSPASKHNGNTYVMFSSLKSNYVTSCQNLATGFNRAVVFNGLSFEKTGGEEGGIALGYGVVSPDIRVKGKRSETSLELCLGPLV